MINQPESMSVLHDQRGWFRTVPPTFERLSPLYAHLYQHVQDDPELFALLGLIDPDQPIPVLFLSVVTFLVLIVAALLAGSISPRVDRLKPFVCVGAVLMALGVFIIVLFPTWSALFLAAALFGGGMGLYLGVDIALVVRVLPNAESQGKDVGIMYTAIFLPLIVMPILGASILTRFAHAFALLFLVAAASSLLAAVLILPIKSVQ